MSNQSHMTYAQFLQVLESDIHGRWRSLAHRLESTLYLCTVLSPKTFRDGGQLLLDARIDPTDSDTVYLVIAGTTTVIASVYAESHGSYRVNGRYARAHGSPGARVRGQGFGALAYAIEAFYQMVAQGYDGTQSPAPGHPDHDRTGSADDLWNNMIASGLARRETEDTHDGADDYEYCYYVDEDRDDYYAGDYGEVEAHLEGEICGTVTATYSIDENRDYLDGDRFIEEFGQLVVYAAVSNQNLVEPSPSWNWSKAGSVDWVQTPEHTGEFTSSFNYLYPRPGEHVISRETAEMLATAFHGPVVKLVMANHKLLIDNGYRDLADHYMNRPEIRAVLHARPSRLLDLRRPERQPPLDGVSAGVMTPGLQRSPLSAKTRKLIDSFPSE